MCDRAVFTHADNDENAPGSPFASMNRHGSEYNVLDDPDRLTPRASVIALTHSKDINRITTLLAAYERFVLSSPKQST